MWKTLPWKNEIFDAIDTEVARLTKWGGTIDQKLEIIDGDFKDKGVVETEEKETHGWPNSKKFENLIAICLGSKMFDTQMTLVVL